MGDIIKVKQGKKVDLPILGLSEFGLTVDEQRLYIGGLSENIAIPNKADIDAIKVSLYDITQGTLQTTSQTIKGAINEINAKPNGGGTTILDTDTAMAANSDTVTPSQKAIKTNLNIISTQLSNLWSKIEIDPIDGGVF